MMKKFDQINVIPFIDIMLVSLAIVLMSATFISQGMIDISLPTAENAETVSPLDNIEISIDLNQQFYYQQRRQSLAQISATLKTVPKQTPIMLSIDKSVAFGVFAQLIDVLKAYELANLSIKTERIE